MPDSEFRNSGFLELEWSYFWKLKNKWIFSLEEKKKSINTFTSDEECFMNKYFLALEIDV